MGLFSSIGNALGNIVGGITGATAAGEAGAKAGQLQYQGAQEGIAENRRQFEKLVELMAPYVQAGNQAIGGTQNLMGLNGAPAQQQAINGIAQSPHIQALINQGEDALLQNASATGGLRGGNIQAALAQYRPAYLEQQIQDQYTKLANLMQMGQAAASGQASAGLQTGQNIAGLLGTGAAAQAGGVMAQGSVNRMAFGDLLGMASVGANYFGRGKK